MSLSNSTTGLEATGRARRRLQHEKYITVPNPRIPRAVASTGVIHETCSTSAWLTGTVHVVTLVVERSFSVVVSHTEDKGNSDVNEMDEEKS